MAILSALAPFISLAAEILQMIGTDEALKYISELNQAKLDLQTEIAKGYYSDDAKIEALYAQIQTLGETVQSQLSVYQAKSITPLSSPASSKV